MVAKPDAAYFLAADLGPPRSKRHQAWRQPSGAIVKRGTSDLLILVNGKGLGYGRLS